MPPLLNYLFISKVRVKLLQVFLSHPDELYYVRQLVRMTNEEINAVRRELAHMEGAEMVKKEFRGNRLYYWFRKDYLFYDDLLRMIIKTAGLGKEIIKQRNKLGRLNYVLFSGRFARHLNREHQEDIDILLIGDIVLPEVTALIQTEEARRKQEINYTVMNEQEFKTRKSGRDPFLANILSQSRVMIIGEEEKLLE